MATTKPGQTVTVTVLRNDESVDEKVTLSANAKVGPQGFLGMSRSGRWRRSRSTSRWRTSVARRPD